MLSEVVIKGCHDNPKKRMRGVGLIEVMVTLLVVSIGVLGIVGLQTTSLQHNQNAYFRSQAAVLANDMMERIRANPLVARNSSRYIISNVRNRVAGCTDDAFVNRCETALCSGAEIAEYDLQQWAFQLTCQLPLVSGSIAVEDVAEGRIYAITITFDDSRGRNAPRQVTLRSTL